MPTMTEIYQSHSFEYDELVSHEDYQGNIRIFLNSTYNFNNKTVLEFGTGTGRLTELYLNKIKMAYCYDRSQHMLDRASSKFKEKQNKISFSVCDNLEIHNLNRKADAVIEGWSFGHTVVENDNQFEKTVKYLVSSCKEKMNVDGIILFMETLGTNTEIPEAPTQSLGDFYHLLENKYGFKKSILETDYRFETNESAERVMGYFFGDSFRKNMNFIGDGIIKEFTGVWSFR
ncbi:MULTISPECIES: class I SAM-dependent methyltransferase [unclassified Oceanispirochaeta]|uniref:class I SAM-dependent methyltransferase n=1 Tax=unclassified Oceanispirochaeta TaxID=2635722 RepID=UPI000E09D931|nr:MULTISPECIES: class I SAM-dependent methyltransferase [unclassified Oceanispirochaeta]MBF9017743.1 class I SAM-dependent methyltransferase [Oceanispirochaeta sp. M2]NPD72146.1 class I SAM-dependent methyltransferase [Oceanispirochaeta sp. M1]RDG32587.1 class I SAM-dependent methyltransferase [Oceanispirochaeta sp. M1]